MYISSKKILFLITEDWFFCSHFLQRALSAKQNGFKIIVCSNQNKHRDFIENNGLIFKKVGFNRKSMNPLYELKILIEIYFIYRFFKPEIVHHIAAKPIIYGSICARLNNIKSVINAPTGLGYVFSSNSIKALILRPIVTYLYKLSLNSHKGKGHRNKVIFENYDDFEFFLKMKAICRQDSCVIRGAGVEINHDLIKQKIVNKKPVVTFLARMLKDKGIFEFISAVKKLKMKNIEATFLLAGDVDPKNPSSINISYLKRWDKEKIITWLGWVEDVKELLRKTDILCLPSYREGLPKALLEGAAMGIPIVTTNAVGCRDVVQNGLNGFLVPIKDDEKLSEALEKLILNKQLRKKMGDAGLKVIKDNFESSIIISQTLKIYEEMES